MNIQLSFIDGTFLEFDGLDTTNWPLVELDGLRTMNVHGSCVVLHKGELAITYRLRRHLTVQPPSVESFFVLFTTHRKIFAFENGTVVIMPEGGEKDAWWQTFKQLSIADLAQSPGYPSFLKSQFVT